MAGAKSIKRRLVHTGESAQPSIGAYGGEKIATTSDNLMSISLMAHVPDKFVVGRIEDIMQCECEFYGSKTRSKVTWMMGECFDNIVSQLGCQLGKIGGWELPKVVNTIDAIQYHPRGAGFDNGIVKCFFV
jgi:hypothetical protein